MQEYPFLGEIRIFAGSFPPEGWAFCDGQLLTTNSNTALLGILGTIYGGNGVTTFALPDLRGRVALGQGTGRGLVPQTLGNKDGSETNSLTNKHLPTHSHSATFTGTGKTSSSGTADLLAVDGSANETDANNATCIVANTGGRNPEPLLSNSTPTSSIKGCVTEITGGGITGGDVSIANAGNGEKVNNMQPYLAINYIICIEGFIPHK